MTEFQLMFTSNIKSAKVAHSIVCRLKKKTLSDSSVSEIREVKRKWPDWLEMPGRIQ